MPSDRGTPAATDAATNTDRRGIDPRGPRFGAGITALLLAVVLFLALTGPSLLAGTTLAQRITDPAFPLLALLAAVFAWGAIAGVRRHPYGQIFQRWVRPLLSPPRELEDEAPPTFAQLVGLLVSLAGLLLAIIGVPGGLAAAAAAGFIAAFLNAAFGYCLGCQLYLLLARLRPARTVA